ncbi:MAG: response regulator [Bacteroidota bacterium]
MKEKSGRKTRQFLSPGKSLRTRLLLWFLAVSALPLFIILIVGLPVANIVSENSAIKSLDFSFRQEFNQIDRYFREVVILSQQQAVKDLSLKLINSIQASGVKKIKGAAGSANIEEYGKTLAGYADRFRKIAKESGFSDMMVVKSGGEVVFSLGGNSLAGSNILSPPLDSTILGDVFRKARAGRETRISVIGMPLKEKEMCYYIVNPVTEGDSVLCYSAVKVQADSLYGMLGNLNDLGSTAVAFLVSPDLRIVASSDPEKPAYSLMKSIENTAEGVQAAAIIKAHQSAGPDDRKILKFKDRSGNPVYGLILPVETLLKFGQTLVLVQEMGKEEAIGGIGGVILLVTILVSGFMVLVFFLSIIISRRIIKPINVLSEWAERVSTGDLSYADIRHSEDEIGKLAGSFRSVVDSFMEISDVSVSMAVGDFEKQVTVRGPKDVLGKSVNDMLASFKNVISQATLISNGDYSDEMQPRGEKDSLGKALQQMTRTLRENSVEMGQQDWLKSGMAELSMKLSGDKSIHDVTHELIKFLVGYLEGQLGLFYLADEQDDLILTATYAFHDRKGNFSRLKPGEGLVGQAALEKEIILFRDVQENAASLNYGVDEKIPAHFIIAPLVFENKIIGVVQVGKLEAFTSLQKKFVEQILEPVSISLNTSTARVKVKQLLDQTQQQTERLQVQQEELRQTNEELEEQTKALRSSEEALQAQQEELRVINEELQERTKTLEQQRDDIRIKNTELTKARNEIEEKAKDLEFASKYKSEFLANMSHELRTPLNSIIVLSQLLSENKRQNLTDKQIEYASTINSSGSDLLDLINEILDLSKIEAGRIELHPETIDLKEILNQMDMFFKPMVEKKGLGFNLNIDGKVPSNIFVDNQRLQQILKNLLSNALKFTEKGTIALEVRRPADMFELSGTSLKLESSLMFTVTDTGIGIPKDKLNIIFEAFQQADGTTSRRFGGTGLGLTISRSFAQVMGGDIRLKSEEGKGSVFILILPEKYEENRSKVAVQEPVQPPAARVPAEPKHRQPRALANENPQHDHRDNLQKGDKVLLIIEDDPAFSQILFDLAEEKGYKCLVARDGESGLYLADLHVPSAIVLDIGLPGIDGWEVMERLHQDAKTRHIPVHFISAMDKSREALQMGAIGYLTKPVSIDKLREAFGRIEDVISKPMKKLLVVDDDLIIQKSIISLIGNGDVTTTAVDTGKEAFSLLEKENFDCLILDLGLKDMSGYDLIEKIRSNSRLAHLPIIIYTGTELSKEEEERLQKYADSIIIKGVRSPERLLAETSLFLHRIEANLPQEKQEMIRMLYSQEDVFHDRTILLVDDDSRNVFAITAVLEERGLNVIPAGNGREGIEKLMANPGVNLVLMDIMMPEMDGYEAIGLIRKMKKYEDLPIIALTAKAMKEDRDHCIEAGANDYLAKPVDSQKLLSLLRVWLYK